MYVRYIDYTATLIWMSGRKWKDRFMYGEQAVEKFWKKSPDFILLQLILPVTEIGHKEIRKLWKSSKNPKTRGDLKCLDQLDRA